MRLIWREFCFVKQSIVCIHALLHFCFTCEADTWLHVSLWPINPLALRSDDVLLQKVSLQETVRKTHLGANRQMNFLTNIVFFLSTQRGEKKNFHKHTNSHLHRDESRCKWAKRCVLELGPWAAQRNEQETPSGISKSVKHVSHFVSSRNDGLIQMQRPQTQFTLWHLHLVSLSQATGETKLLDFKTLWTDTQYPDQSPCLWLFTFIFPSRVVLWLCVFVSSWVALAKKKTQLHPSLNVYFVKHGYGSTKANILHEIKYGLWRSAEYTAVW